MLIIWLQFIVSAVIIIIAGTQLTTYADILSDRLRLGKVWIGVVLLGLVTSLPEAITSLVSVLSLQAVDLAVGNLVGSNNFNLMLIFVLDAFYRYGPVTDKIQTKRSHYVSAFFAVGLSVILLCEIYFGARQSLPTLGYLSVGNILICLVYCWGIKILSGVEGQLEPIPTEVERETHEHADMSLGKICGILLLSGALVVGSAMILAKAADVIAMMTGLGGTFVGSIFLAFVTSLPEMIVTISALKIGAFDLALGNIFGSNMINTFIVFVCGLFYTTGPVLANVSQSHILTIVLSIILTGVVLLGIRTKPKKPVMGLGWDSILLVILFLIGTGILYSIK